jgi:hypothetical protein
MQGIILANLSNQVQNPDVQLPIHTVQQVTTQQMLLTQLNIQQTQVQLQVSTQAEVIPTVPRSSFQQQPPMIIQQEPVPNLSLVQPQQLLAAQVRENIPPHPGETTVPLYTHPIEGQVGQYTREIGHIDPGGQSQTNDGTQAVPVSQPQDGDTHRLTREEKGKAVMEESPSYLPLPPPSPDFDQFASFLSSPATQNTNLLLPGLRAQAILASLIHNEPGTVPAAPAPNIDSLIHMYAMQEALYPSSLQPPSGFTTNPPPIRPPPLTSPSPPRNGRPGGSPLGASPRHASSELPPPHPTPRATLSCSTLRAPPRRPPPPCSPRSPTHSYTGSWSPGDVPLEQIRADEIDMLALQRRRGNSSGRIDIRPHLPTPEIDPFPYRRRHERATREGSTPTLATGRAASHRHPDQRPQRSTRGGATAARGGTAAAVVSLGGVAAAHSGELAAAGDEVGALPQPIHSDP